MYKYTLLNNISQNGLNIFGADFKACDNLAQADIAIVRSAKLHDVKTEHLLAVARAGAGTNNIPVLRCADEGVVVFNTPGANANAVKELLILGMLLSARDVFSGNEWMRSLSGSGEELSQKVEKGKSAYKGSEISGKIVAIIGMGEIGSILANTLQAMGMKIKCFSPSFSNGKKPKKLKIYLEPENSHLDTVKDADYVVLALPLNDDTRGSINSTFFNHMKENSVLLNFSRAGLIDEDALDEALNASKIRKYVTDFTTDRVLSMKNTICLPHMGASTTEATDNCSIMAVNQVKDYVVNGNIKNSVNYPDIEMGNKQGKRLSVLFYGKEKYSKNIEDVMISGGVEIIGLTSVSKNERGAILLDINDINDDVISEIKELKHVKRVRLLK